MNVNDIARNIGIKYETSWFDGIFFTDNNGSILFSTLERWGETIFSS